MAILLDILSFVSGLKVLDKTDDLSNHLKMEAVKLSKDFEEIAAKLGASPSAIAKWRQRGVPYKWQLQFLRAAASDKETKDMADKIIGGGAA